ncbi:MAG: phosphoglucosamine mutase, partial [Candidatus Omnitrophica bacterium]|nr:phosphoglucosamine mutase [Candidatus Omnitrophota bacterium]
ILARDARPHGGSLLSLAEGLLAYRGRRVLIAGLVPTPTVGVLVRDQRAAGGVMLTASHNPLEWNALKLFNHEGLILTPAEFDQLKPIFENPPEIDAYPYLPGGSSETLGDPLRAHFDSALRQVDPEIIRKRKFRVVVDGCHSVGGIAVPAILKEVGAEVVELDCTPDGQFSRGLEPIPENIQALGQEVQKNNADIGMAVDPDADRLALVSDRGEPIGEELTLVMAADAVLGAGGHGLVANLSSTLILDKVAEKHGSPMHRSKVGESHVVDLIHEKQASIGGEGNGGVILPAVQGGRDSISGALLVLQLLAREGKSVTEMVATYPRSEMVKAKIPATDGLWESLESKAGDWWPDAEVNRLDGLKWIWPDKWIHLRPSNTEPIIRILAEAT